MFKRLLIVFLIAASATVGFAQDPENPSTQTYSAKERHHATADCGQSGELPRGLGSRNWRYVCRHDRRRRTWKAAVVPGAEALQFRDVYGVSDKVAYLMSIGDNTTDFRIYKTVDGGATWTIEFTNRD